MTDWTGDVIYMILVDRFHRGEGGAEPQAPWMGGNIRGVLQKLDYLQDLGVTALWLSPLYLNQRDGYHGYWPVDFRAVDPRFGTLEELQGLVRACHGRGLKVLLDIVLNHAGYEHPMARDPKYRGWFHHSGGMYFVDETSLQKGSLHGLPDFAQENPEVARFLIDHAVWWLENTGVDGFRLDAVKHVPSEFWKRFSTEVHAKAEPGFLLLGEVYRGVPGYIGRYQSEDGIDSVFDVPFADTVRTTLARDCETPGPGLLERLRGLRKEYQTMLFNEILRRLFSRRPADMRWFSELFKAESHYLRPNLLATFIDNHDLSRFASEADDAKRLEMALTLLMTWRGVPVLTYGTEAGMRGRTDGSHRAMMPFGSNPELHALTRRLIRMRRSHPALGRGVQKELRADREVYAFMREAEGTRTLTVLNNSRGAQSRELELPAGPGWEGPWRDASDGEVLSSLEGGLEVRLAPRSARVLSTVPG